ncbi:hypothetical protein MMC09_004523 [Bachmanniomyces sp. S44760]|nr:hypothetical protein [Bachmanniomyces sp. S44760]
MLCIESPKCGRQFETWERICPRCKAQNPLYGVSLLVTTAYSTGHPVAIEVEPVNGVPKGELDQPGPWKIALLDHETQKVRRYVIITNAQDGTLTAEVWNRNPYRIQQIPQGLQCTTCPPDRKFPSRITASPCLDNRPKWVFDTARRSWESQELEILVDNGSEVAAWIFHMSRLA